MVKCIFGVMKISFNILFLPVFLQKAHLEIVSVSNEYSNETVSVFFIFLFFLYFKWKTSLVANKRKLEMWKIRTVEPT